MHALDVNKAECKGSRCALSCVITTIPVDTVVYPQENYGAHSWHLYFVHASNKSFRVKRAHVCERHDQLLLQLIEQTTQQEKDEYAATVYDQVRRESAEQALYRTATGRDAFSYRVDY